MKVKVLILFGILFVLNAGAATQYRDFMDSQGRSIRGRVLRYDAKKRAVTMERDNKKVVTVPLSIFSDKDQEYVLAWEFNKVFLSESSFKITAKRKEVKDKDESYDSFVHAKKVENMGYELILENRSTSKLQNLELEYCIYYEQERSNRGKQLCEQGVRCESVEVPYLSPKSKKELMTETVRVYKTELDADYYYTSGSQNVQKGKVHGIWVRAHMKLDSGETITRDYCLPDSLNNKKAWASSSVGVGMNSSRKKKK